MDWVCVLVVHVFAARSAFWEGAIYKDLKVLQYERG